MNISKFGLALIIGAATAAATATAIAVMEIRRRQRAELYKLDNDLDSLGSESDLYFEGEAIEGTGCDKTLNKADEKALKKKNRASLGAHFFKGRKDNFAADLFLHSDESECYIDKEKNSDWGENIDISDDADLDKLSDEVEESPEDLSSKEGSFAEDEDDFGDEFYTSEDEDDFDKTFGFAEESKLKRGRNSRKGK